MKIEIIGKPISQSRMRIRRFKNFSSVYDPNAKDKKSIRKTLEEYRGDIIYDYPQVSFVFDLPIPASCSRKEYEEMKNGNVKHTKKPDIDNLIKLYLDCMTDIIIDADQKVELGPSVKVYSTEPKTTIYIFDRSKKIDSLNFRFDFLNEHFRLVV